jgi:hypothetical protein
MSMSSSAGVHNRDLLATLPEMKKTVAERTAQHVGDDREISKRLTNSRTALQAEAQWENKRTRTVPTNTHSER